MTPFKKSRLVQLLWSEMTRRRVCTPRQVFSDIVSRQQRSTIEIHHSPPSATRPNGAEQIRPQVKDTRPEQTPSDESFESRDTSLRAEFRRGNNDFEHRFWNETTKDAESPVLADPNIIVKPNKSLIDATHPSIAAATIIGVIVFGAICFLLFWYIRRERRRRRLSEIQSPSSDLFNPSSLTLGPETSKTLDDFLMRDVPPERTSLMFSRTRSPSVTYLIDEANRHSNRNSYDESSTLTKLETLDSLTRVSADGVRPIFMLPDLSSSLPGPSLQTTSAQHTSITSPRASLAGTLPPSPRSSQLWTTTTAATTASTSIKRSSLLAQQSSVSQASQPMHKSQALPSPVTSLMQPRSSNSNTSRTSRRYSGGDIVRSSPRGIYDSRGARPVRTRSSQSVSPNVSPHAESNSSGHLPSIPSTPSPLFRFSDA
ncbi:uncharacterized protein N7477_001018 [Penicillium maclennaniae]|uniref:uncharacterized protein n=1 Tax=Penicillium maclennaniae TaxID=1343394 RepID=UPI00253FC436|nr:uncharacterized protein N7477_001018 [Penicillium maclennaniae]KAJ5684673.1 hypothetical protein N7477_001018 [Penicillium maclennaniae]